MPQSRSQSQPQSLAIAALIISLMSAAIAGLNTYIQWFWKSPSIGIELEKYTVQWASNTDIDPEHKKFTHQMDVTLPIAFVNDGNEAIVIQDMQFQLYRRKQPALECASDTQDINPIKQQDWQFFMETGSKIPTTPIVTRPGEIVSHKIQFGNTYGDPTDQDSWTGCIYFEVVAPGKGRTPQSVVAFAILPPNENPRDVKQDVKTDVSHYTTYAFESEKGLITTNLFNASVKKLDLNPGIR